MSAPAGMEIEAPTGDAAAPTRSPVVRARAARDPLALMLAGRDGRSDLFYATLAAAFALHVGLLGFALAGELLKDLRVAMADNRARLHEYFWRQYDVELAPKPKAAEKAPEPPPEPDPVPTAPAPVPRAVAPPKEDDPYKNLPPPTPAKAAAVLVAKENPDEPRDLTGNTVVTGDGKVTYGQQSGEGTGDRATMNAAASHAGVAGGKGTGPVAPAAAPPGPDLSKPGGLQGGSTWNCPFAPEADSDQIDQAAVTVQVTVRPDGSALSAKVVADPGHGFGRAARACALARRYSPALDRTGAAILSSTPVNVRFNR